eukprot:gene22354-29449_t
MVLGAVINPNKYLPYCVATITLVAHTGATYARVMNIMKMYEERVKAIVIHVFESKLKSALEFAQKAAAQAALEEANEKMSDAVSKVQDTANRAVNTASGAVGGVMAKVPGGATGDTPSPAPPAPPAVTPPAPAPPAPGYQPVPTTDFPPGAVPMGQYPPYPQMQHGMMPGYGYPMPPGGGGYMPVAAGDPNALAGVPVIQSGPAMGWGLGGVGIPGRGFNLMPTVNPNAGHLPPGAEAGAAPAAASAGGAAGKENVGPNGEPVPLNPFQIFKLYAKDESGLGYVDFCQLLDHLEIKLVGDKRREMFANYTSKTRKKMGYKEFEACYKKIQKSLVMQSLIEAGVTKGRMIAIVIWAVFVLILIFIFIFVGVAAFTGAGTVGAVINSLLAAGSGIALNLKGGDEAKTEQQQPVVVKVGDEQFLQASDGTLTALNADGTAAS